MNESTELVKEFGLCVEIRLTGNRTRLELEIRLHLWYNSDEK